MSIDFVLYETECKERREKKKEKGKHQGEVAAAE